MLIIIIYYTHVWRAIIVIELYQLFIMLTYFSFSSSSLYFSAPTSVSITNASSWGSCTWSVYTHFMMVMATFGLRWERSSSFVCDIRSSWWSHPELRVARMSLWPGTWRSANFIVTSLCETIRIHYVCTHTYSHTSTFTHTHIHSHTYTHTHLYRGLS